MSRSIYNEGDSLRELGLGIAVRDETHQDVEDEIDIDGEDEVIYGAAQFTEGDVIGSRPLSVDEDEDVQIEDEGESRDQSPTASGSGSGQVAFTTTALRQLVVEGKVVKKAGAVGEGLEDVKKSMDEVMGVGEAEEVERAVELARKSGDASALVAALESKVKLLVSSTPRLACASPEHPVQESTRVSSSTSLLCRICIDPYTEPTVSTGCWHTCCRECWLRCLGSTRLCPICKRITAPADLRRIYL